MGYKLHPRHEPVVLAGIDISKAIREAAQKYELTYAELISILAQQIASWTKSEIREERGSAKVDTVVQNGRA